MVASGAIIELANSGQILLIQRSPDLDWHPNEWETLYGRIDQFEDTKTGLMREVKEEIGITDLKIMTLLSAWHIFRGSDQIAENELIGVTYHCQTNQDKITLSDEHQAYRWVTPQEALNLVLIEGIRNDIKSYIELVMKK